MKKIQDKWKEKLDKLYEQEPYLLVRYSSSELAEKLGISAPYMRSILSELNLSFKNDVTKLIIDYPPYKYTYKELLRYTKLNITRITLNKYSKKVYGIFYIHENEKMFDELKDEFKEMLKEYKYPLVQLGKRGMMEYLGLTEKQLYYFLNKIGFSRTKKDDIKKVFKDYDLEVYSVKDISDDLGVSISAIHKWKQRYLHKNRKIKSVKTIKRLNTEKELYGAVGSERKMSLKDIKIYFEDKLRTNGEVTTKELRALGYKSFNKWLYTIRKRYGINVDYKYNKKELKYELVR